MASLAAGRSRDGDEARFQPDREVFLQAQPQVGLALGLFQKAEHAHLRTVLGAGPDLDWAGAAELGVRRFAVLVRGEARNEPALDRLFELGVPVGGQRRAARGCLAPGLFGLD